MSNLRKTGLLDIDGPILITKYTVFKRSCLTLLLDDIGIEWARISRLAQKILFYKLIKSKNKNKEYLLNIRKYHQVARSEQTPIEACFQQIEELLNEL